MSKHRWGIDPECATAAEVANRVEKAGLQAVETVTASVSGVMDILIDLRSKTDGEIDRLRGMHEEAAREARGLRKQVRWPASSVPRCG